LREFLIGKLDGNSLPHEWFTIGGTAAFVLMMLLIAGYLTYKKRWKWLWKEWLTSVDPKKIGIMYFIVGGFMLLRGILDALMIWLQQSLAAGASHGYLSSEHFQEIFTAHGNIMVFFVAMAFIFGLINYIVPLQIGARDLASPFMNTLGFWLFVGGVVMVNMFFLFGGQYAATGWLAVAPLSGKEFSPGVGVDYWIWSLQISGIGTTLGAINFIMTILKMRVKGMTLWKMPAFTWGSLCSMLMAATIFPILTMTLFLVFFDRYLGTHFFTTTAGGNAMLYSNLIWMWGHPEVYVLILPAYAIFSEIVAVFSRKPVANYKSNVFGLIGVASLSLVVWLHHFFTMGSSADVNAFFGIMTVFVAIPTTVLVFNWIATMYKGRIRLDTPMLWFLGFAGVFAIGGITGVLLAVPSIDFQLHNSLFLVAHFHSTVIGGVVFGVFAGISYWFPKFTGFRLNERLGRYAFWLWIVGYFMSFVPMFILGLMGASRRLDHYDASTGWQPFFIVSLIGGIVITAGVTMQVVQIIASFIEKKRLMDTTGDPWDARTLEWSVASPAPAYNFAALPDVSERDGFWAMKQAGLQKPTYEDIHMPKNTASGIYLSIYAFLTGFGFVWDIKWLIIVGIVGMIYTFITRTFDEDSEYKIAASDVEKSEQEHFVKMQEVEKSRDQSKIGPEYDMGLSDFIKIVWKWLLGLARHKK
jgi:cytochrome o ubiquinol oxidase subunit 1